MRKNIGVTSGTEVVEMSWWEGCGIPLAWQPVTVQSTIMDALFCMKMRGIRVT